MTEQPDASPRRVVKKVVKKTVVRPVSVGSPRSTGTGVGRPAVTPVTRATTRPGAARLTTPARAQASRAVAPTPPAQVAVGQPTPASSASIRGRASGFSHGIGDAFLGVRHRIEDAWDWLVSMRLPHLSRMLGSAVTGIIVGALAVAIGWGFYEIFSATLGTQAGGGWGFLAFVFLSFVALHDR